MEILAGCRSTRAFRLSNLATRGTLETGGKSVVDSSEVKREDGILQGAPEHNPMECRGDNGGKCCADDPCWSCIQWAFDTLEDIQRALATR